MGDPVRTQPASPFWAAARKSPEILERDLLRFVKGGAHQVVKAVKTLESVPWSGCHLAPGFHTRILELLLASSTLPAPLPHRTVAHSHKSRHLHKELLLRHLSSTPVGSISPHSHPEHNKKAFDQLLKT